MPEVIEARRQALNTTVLTDGTSNAIANNMLGNNKDSKADSTAVVNGGSVNIKFEHNFW